MRIAANVFSWKIVAGLFATNGKDKNGNGVVSILLTFLWAKADS